MRGRRSGRDLRPVERWKCGRHALSVGLMASSAVRGVDGLAARGELLYVPDPGRIVRGGSRFPFLRIGPGRVLVRRQDLDDHRHESMLLAAQLGALAAIDARLVGTEPGVAHEAGNRILLDSERRNPP